MHPSLTPVTSSTVEAWGWIPGAMDRLFVEFKSNKIYEYTVPGSVTKGMLSAQSKGTFINQMKKSYIGVLVNSNDVMAAFADVKKASGAKRTKPKRFKLTAFEMLPFAFF